MKIRFGAITEFTGPPPQIEAHLDALREQNIGYLPAQFNGRAVVLGGEDTDRFLRETFDIELPAELKGKSKREAGEIITVNHPKYQPLIEKLDAMASDASRLATQIFAYVDARKAEGADAEGNSIQQQEIK